jgi:hypothetical protein
VERLVKQGGRFGQLKWKEEHSFSLRTEVFFRKNKKMHFFPGNGFGQFLCLGDRSHHQSLKSYGKIISHSFSH